jgi:hypothetical protein
LGNFWSKNIQAKHNTVGHERTAVKGCTPATTAVADAATMATAAADPAAVAPQEILGLLQAQEVTHK